MAKTSYGCASAEVERRRSMGTRRRMLLACELLRRHRPRVRGGRVMRGRRRRLSVQRVRLFHVAELLVRLRHQELDERIVLARLPEIGECGLGVAAVEGDVAGEVRIEDLLTLRPPRFLLEDGARGGDVLLRLLRLSAARGQAGQRVLGAEL